jgi:hypothetical protein
LPYEIQKIAEDLAGGMVSSMPTELDLRNAWWAGVVLSSLKPEERVMVAVSMVDAVTRICADSDRERDPSITEDRLISLIRRRFHFGRCEPRRRRRARAESTVKILEDLPQSKQRHR